MAEEGLGLDLSLFSGSVSGFQSKWSNDSSPRHRSSPICVDLSSGKQTVKFSYFFWLLVSSVSQIGGVFVLCVFDIESDFFWSFPFSPGINGRQKEAICGS